MITRSPLIAFLLATAVASSGAVAASAAPISVAHTSVSTRVAKVQSGTGLKWTGHGVTVREDIDAFPAGGKGSGSEAVCANWGTMLQNDENNATNAKSQGDFNKAVNDLASDVNSALDAGCAVIY